VPIDSFTFRGASLTIVPKKCLVFFLSAVFPLGNSVVAAQAHFSLVSVFDCFRPK